MSTWQPFLWGWPCWYVAVIKLHIVKMLYDDAMRRNRLVVLCGGNPPSPHTGGSPLQWVSNVDHRPLTIHISTNRVLYFSWWRHQLETFSALLAIFAGNSPVPGEFPAQMPVTRSFDVFFDLRLNKRLSKQSWGRWFETPSCPLWRHCNVIVLNIWFV